MKKSRKNKFLLVGTSTVLIASAIAPVALAKSYKDVPVNSSHFTSIDYLSDKKIVSGYGDNSFKPGRQLSRSDVVKMMGKFLVADGKSIPSDYKSKMRFKDLGSKSQGELLQYAALAYDQGLFQGSNGNLMHNNPISRQQMAVVLSRLIAKRYNVSDLSDVMDFAKAFGGTIEVTDLNAAVPDYRDEIELLDLLEITTVKQFNPQGTTTRGQFASFLYRTLENNMINKFIINKDVPLKRAEIAADGLSVKFTGITPGVTIKVLNGNGQLLGQGTANSSGDLTIALNPALKANDTIKLVVTLPNGVVIECDFPQNEWELGGGLVSDGKPNPNPNPGQAEGLQALQDLITKANGSKVAVSTNGSDVAAAQKWTTQEALNALEKRITDAAAVSVKKGVTTAEVTEATTLLQTALNEYESAKQNGKKANLEALKALVDEANKGIVPVSTNGADIEITKQWTTQSALDAFKVALNGAVALSEKTDILDSEAAEAITKLNDAMSTYNAAKQNGKKANLDALKALIEEANKGIVPVSSNGSEIETTKQWTTQKALDDYKAAVNEAVALAAKTNVLDTEVAEAITKLKDAMSTYNAAKQKGQKPDLSNLANAIKSAKGAIVKVSTNGADIPEGEDWTSQQALTTLEAAIEAAQKVSDNPKATQTEVAQAQTALVSALNTYNSAKTKGTQTVLKAERSISNVALKTSETQYNAPVGGKNVNSAVVGFNVAQLQLGSTIGGDVLGTNPKIEFSVPNNSELSFTFRATLSAVLGLGTVELGVYKKGNAGSLTRVWLDNFEYLSAVGAPMQNKYNYAVEGLEAGDYVILAAPPAGVTLNLLGGMAFVFTSSVIENKSSSINTALSTRSVNGKVNFNNDAKITAVTPQGKSAVSNVGAPIEGTYGRLTIDAQTGQYTYTANGHPDSVGKVETFEYEVTRGTQKAKEFIHIQHNASDGANRIPLKWDEANPTSHAAASVLVAQSKNVTPSAGAAVRTTIPDASRSYANDVVTSDVFFVTGEESTVTFQPINELGNTTKFELYPVGNTTTPTKTETLGLATSLRSDIEWTGIPRGEYVIRAHRQSGTLAFRMKDMVVVNKPYMASDVTGQLFTNNASVAPNTVSYVAPGSLVYVDQTLVTDSSVIQGKYGTLTVKKDGTYTYKTTNQNSKFASNPSEIFDVEVHANDGTSKKTTLTIRFGNSSAFVPSTFYSMGDTPVAHTVDYKGE